MLYERHICRCNIRNQTEIIETIEENNLFVIISRFEKLCRACVLCMLWYVSTLNKTLFIYYLFIYHSVNYFLKKLMPYFRNELVFFIRTFSILCISFWLIYRMFWLKKKVYAKLIRSRLIYLWFIPKYWVFQLADQKI